MGNKKLLAIIIGIINFAFITSFVSAIPDIQILSPENITYSESKILVNVTSNETVDFFFKNLRTGEKIILAENVTSLESFIYAKNGSYEFTIWANNSNGEKNESVFFGTTAYNPIEVNSCGYLYSSNAAYFLIQDIFSTDGRRCLNLYELRNVTLDLNGHTIVSGEISGLGVRFSSNIEVFNGSINGSNSYSHYGGIIPFMLELEGTKYNFHDININGYVGIIIWALDQSLFENIIINSTIGFLFVPVTTTYLINSSISWNGYTTSDPHYPSSTAFWDQSTNHAELFLQEINITGFPEYDFYLEGTVTDFYLRNTVVNLSKIYYTERWIVDTNFFTQHLILINVTDQFNETGSGVIEVIDNGILPRKSEFDAITETLTNPTSNFLVATDESGIANFWLTEKLTLVKMSPLSITEYDFSPYNLTARSWNSNTTSQLNLTGANFTIPVDFKIEVSKALPTCTLTQILDLNNDGDINILDAILILRHITGEEVEIGAPKDCEAKSIFAP